MPSDTSAKVAFRVVASPFIGGGHVVRSVSIADALAASGASCTFFTNEESVVSAPLLDRSGHRLIATPRGTAATVARAGDEGGFDWVVVDDYTLAATDETPWRAVANKILVVDDLADRSHDCDLLLDSTPARRAEDYDGLVPQGAQLLAGPAYAPLRAEFAARRWPALKRRKQTTEPQRLLVSFGLMDPDGITADAVAAITAGMPHLAMDVVLGAASQSRAKIEALAPAHITLHIDPPSMSDLMVAADMALGAGGSTAWERACLGLPSVALILADNQHALAEGLAQRGALTAVGQKDDWPAVIASLKGLSENSSVWRAMSFRAALACDGLGANRVALELNPPLSRRGVQVRLRPVQWDDSDRIFAWQTAPGAREFSSNPNPPAREEHQIWMARKLDEPGCVLNVITEGHVPVGVLRLDRRLDGSFMTSILVAAQARGRGIGLAALQAGARLTRGAELWAKIDSRNAVSLRMFARAGFTLHDESLYRRASAP